MHYCSGVWGYTQSKELDNIHFRAARCFLGVNKYAPKLGIEGDMGWISPDIRRKVEVIRFWNRVIGMDNYRLPKIVYNDMTKNGHPWLDEIRNIFVLTKTMDVFTNNVPVINQKLIKGALMSEHTLSWKKSLLHKTKLEIYQKYKVLYRCKDYCKINLRISQRSLIAKMRLGVFPINLETGRYNNVPRLERYCDMCDLRLVEDEIHVLFYCPAYSDQRTVLMNLKQLLDL